MKKEKYAAYLHSYLAGFSVESASFLVVAISRTVHFQPKILSHKMLRGPRMWCHRQLVLIKFLAALSEKDYCLLAEIRPTPTFEWKFLHQNIIPSRMTAFIPPRERYPVTTMGILWTSRYLVSRARSGNTWSLLHWFRGPCRNVGSANQTWLHV